MDDVGARLNFYSALLDGAERTRIDAGNRIGAYERAGITPDGAMVAIFQHALAIEGVVGKQLDRTLRGHPLHGFCKQEHMHGVGVRQLARLLATIGDPLIRPAVIDRETKEIIAPERPRRGPDELKQYCGHGDPERSQRRKGHRVEYNPAAKMRLRMVADRAQQSGVRKLDGCDDTQHYDLEHRHAVSHLGQVYLDARAAWVDHECERCKGPCSKAHQDNHALRIVGKEILKDLWRYARATPGAEPTHAPPARAPKELVAA